MVSNHYPAFVEEAFIEPIRSVLIVDDDFPTYDEVLTTAGRSGTPTPRNRAKAWRRQPGRIADLISTFRRRPRPLLVDIHDGANVSPGNKSPPPHTFINATFLYLTTSWTGLSPAMAPGQLRFFAH